MATQDVSDERIALLQGTLDLLILRTLIFGRQHGQGLARAIRQQSQNVLLIDHGTLYPALQRLEEKGWIDAEWGDRKSTRLNSSHTVISYAVFCLKTKNAATADRPTAPTPRVHDPRLPPARHRGGALIILPHRPR